MAGTSSPSLASLPLVALDGIMEALCPHCTEDTEFSPWRTPIHHFGGQRRLLASTQALANLAVTCWALNDSATRFLYHQPQGWSTRRVALYRTLAKRPELASRVKVLRLDYDDGLYELPEDKNDRDFLLDLATRHGWSHAPESLEEEGTQDLLTSLLMAMCPNLEKVSTGLGYPSEFPLLQFDTLPHLKDIYVSHIDTEMGTDLGSLDGLFDAAPNLEAFTSNMAAGVGDMALRLGNVRDLRLDWSCISTECLRTLLRSCPRLESFTYGAAGPIVGNEQFIAQSVRKLLLRYTPKLKHLHVDLRYGYVMLSWGADEDNGDDGNDPEPAPGFASLSCLETLTVDLQVLNDWDTQQPVATLFPQSLRSLTLLAAYSPDRAKLGAKELKEFASTARDLLPNLQHYDFAKE
ncbi:hypothetical protein N0V88_004170 [Collariella sp. IMI 366227]|nr:hypothetical protein N0V88_004170 [Collariella sp. IMI 366227]